MKKILILVLVLVSILPQVEAQSRRKTYHPDAPLRVGIAAGGAAFILAGALQQTEKRWVVDPNSQSTNSYAQHGYWRDEKVWENIPRSACFITGALLLCVSISIKF